MRDKILRELSEIEQKNNVRILFACEFGPRSYGFEAPNLEHDVRFIYTKPLEHYFSITEEPEVLNRVSNNCEFDGIDLKLALRSVKNSNNDLLECLKSNIVYVSAHKSIQQIQDLLDQNFSLYRTWRHYRVVSEHIFKHEISGKQEWQIMRLLVCIRNLMANRFIETFKKFPPNNIIRIMKDVDVGGRILQYVSSFLDKLQENGVDATLIREPKTEAWIERELKNTENLKMTHDNIMDVGALDSIFFNHFKPEMRNLK